MYPMQSLVIIAPIVFIVLMIAFPLIGFFAGWKRAVFWGAGNLLFYIIGLVIWAIFGGAIGNLIGPKLQDAISALKNADLSKIATSIVAPVFFLIVMFVGNIVLIINYYTWFKRVAKLRKVDKQEAAAPTVKFKMSNGVIGAVALPALLLPTTFAFTQAIFYATTTTSTRASNKMAKNLYSGLDNCNEAFKWFSYYKDTAKDYDALFTGLNITKIKIEYKDIKGNIITGTLEQAISGTFKDGYDEIYLSTKDLSEKLSSPDPEVLKNAQAAVATDVNNLADSWNSIVKAAENEMSPIFASSNATKLLTDILDIQTSKADITPDNYDKIYGADGAFQQALDAYEEGEFGGVTFTKFNVLDVPEDSFNNIVDTMMGYYDLSKLPQQEQKDVVKNSITDLCLLLFNPK